MIKNCRKLFNLNLVNSISLIKNSRSTSHYQSHDEYDSYFINQQSNHNQNEVHRSNSNKKIHPFRNLYPWKNLNEFVDDLESRIIYNDLGIIAIDKPWGVAYHKAVKTFHKPYSFEALSLVGGEPKFCILDALPILEDRLNLNKIELVKTIDRYSSGVILFATDPKTKIKIQKAIKRNKNYRELFYKFHCIAQGFPAIDGDELSEVIRIKLTDLDELADYKEPIILDAKYKHPIDKGYLTRVNLKIKSINKKNASSYLEVSANRVKWNFVRCYVANKAAFILGDLRFSANIKRILGEQVIETTNKFYKNNQIEPLNKEIRSALKVNTNRKIPIMLHLESIQLKDYMKAGDILISTKKLPDHFEFALKNLEL